MTNFLGIKLIAAGFDKPTLYLVRVDLIAGFSTSPSGEVYISMVAESGGQQNSLIFLKVFDETMAEIALRLADIGCQVSMPFATEVDG